MPAMKRAFGSLTIHTAAVCLALNLAIPRLDAQELPGRRSDGSVLLPTGWTLRPHGIQTTLESDLPIRMQWHPSRPIVAVQHAGYRDHRVEILEWHGGKSPPTRIATWTVPKSWSGMAWGPSGEQLFVSGGVDDMVHVFDISNLQPSSTPKQSTHQFAVGTPGVLDLPAGICASGDGSLWLCLQRTDKLVHLTADGTVRTTVNLPSGSMPFECALSRDGETVFVSLWGRESILAIETESGAPIARIPTGQHPSEMCVGQNRLFVSNGNENSVTVLDIDQLRVSETIGSALFPIAPPGSTPNSVDLSPDGAVLLVANADNNNCAVLDVREPGRSKSLGFIPVGWYPTSIRFSPDGSGVLVANGKGSAGSRANPDGPQPDKRRKRDTDQYIGSMFRGSLSSFPFPSPSELQRLSVRAYACAPLEAAAQVRGLTQRPANSPIPGQVGDPSPIHHCVYIIKENRTYDQVYGDLGRGNGDADLCLFPRKVTPNHHAIVDEFVLLDNFYVESEVSADGHEWTMAAYASDFVERSWPVSYGRKGNGEGGGIGYPAEGSFEIAAPKNRYLFDLAAEGGVSFRSYGEFVRNGPTPQSPGTASIPVLKGNFDPMFRGYDLNYSDVARADRFLTELERFEREGEMPQLIVLRLPNDHAAGTRVGMPTPRAMVADNDLGLGKIVEALSNSRFWPSTTVFVVQDDAQNGPDHVDAHRTVAMVAGPYVKRGGTVVSTMYSTASMLRTIELILGLPPMSQFDAAATPMYDCFTDHPDLTPYVCRDATWPLNEMNKKTSWGAELSEKMNLATEDSADDILLNEIVWKSVKGPDSAMPMPRRAAFVQVHPEKEGDGQ